VKKSTTRDRALKIAQLAAEKKGQDVVLMDMHKVSAVCDWFVLVSATSSRGIKTISRNVQDFFHREKEFPLNVAGKDNPYWTVVDYGDVIVHIFHKDIREFYGLERLWSDSPREHLDEKCLAKTSQKQSQKPS
jgi:ribosome-associated protein